MPLPRVLVVEDDPAIRSMIAAALRRETLDVDVASDGVEALDHLSHHEYAVILADLMMPRMNGFALTEALRSIPMRVRPVVFVMTAFDDVAMRDLEPTIVHGCFRKPFDVARVVEVVFDCAMLLQKQMPESGEAAQDDALGTC